MSYCTSSETKKKPLVSLTFNLENMGKKRSFTLLDGAAVWSALCKLKRVPAECPGELQRQQSASQPDNQSAALVCHLAKPGDWFCHSEWVGKDAEVD